MIGKTMSESVRFCMFRREGADHVFLAAEKNGKLDMIEKYSTEEELMSEWFPYGPGEVKRLVNYTITYAAESRFATGGIVG